jgi:PAS domain S-box-containing protein
VVAIGASAGGLAGFTALLKALQAASGMAFVLIRHLEPKHASALKNLLSKATSMPVIEVSDGMAAEPDHVYVIPPNKNVTIRKGILRLAPRSATSGFQHPIDEFSIALAEEPGNAAIGVVLPGKGSDETRGHFTRAVVETIHESLAVLDSQCRVLSVNRSFCDSFQVSQKDIEGKAFFGVGPGQFNAPELRKQIRNSLSKEFELKDVELDLHFPEAGRRRLVLNARRIEATKTTLIAIADVTEHKQAAEAAEKNQATIRALLDSSTQSVVAVDVNKNIVLVNGNTEKMFGYRREELLGEPLEILIPESSRVRHIEHHKAYLADMKSRPMGLGLDLGGRRKDGTIFPVEIGLSAIETAMGKLAVAFVADITVRKQLEQTAQAQAKKVRELAAGLLTAQEDERRKVSRELHDRTSQDLASLAMDLGVLADDPLLASGQSRIRALQARAVQASADARNLAYELHPSILDDLGLAASLRDLCQRFSSRAKDVFLRSTGIALTIPVPREVASCIYRVAQESLQNIYKHARATRVSVALALRKGAVVLTIADNGAGFDPQAAKGRRGLGLIGMEERAHLVNGTLSITSSPGHGTRMVLNVPLPPASE